MPEKKEEMPIGIRKAIPSVAGVRCDKCGALHDAESDQFVAIYGNVSVGLEKVEVVTGNIDEKGKLLKVTILCRDKPCVKGIMSKMLLASEHNLLLERAEIVE